MGALLGACSGQGSLRPPEPMGASHLDRAPSSESGPGLYADPSDLDTKTGKIKDADHDGVPDRSRVVERESKELARRENTSRGVTLATWVVGTRGLFNPGGSVGLANFLARTTGGFIQSVSDAGVRGDKFVKPEFDSNGQVKTVSNLELLKLVWSRGNPQDSLKAQEVTNLVNVILKASGDREKVEQVAESINSFTKIFYAVYADPETKRIPIAVSEKYRSILLADYGEVLGKSRMDADRRLELSGVVVQDLAIAFGADAAAKYLGEVSEKLGAKTKLSVPEIRKALSGVLGAGDVVSPALRNPITMPFFENAPGIYTGTLSQCLARALSHGAQLGCAMQAAHHLDRPIMEWTLVNTPQAVVLDGDVDMQKIWRASFNELGDFEKSMGTRLDDRAWLFRLLDFTVAHYRSIILEKMRQALGGHRTEASPQLLAAMNLLAAYLSEAKIHDVIQAASTEELPDLMVADAKPEVLDFLSALSKPSKRYKDLTKAESLVSGVFRRLFLDPEFQAVFVAAAEDIRLAFLSRFEKTVIPTGTAPADLVRRKAMIERLRNEVTTKQVVAIIFARLAKESGVARPEDIDPYKAFLHVAKKSDRGGDRTRVDDLVLGIVEDLMVNQTTKAQALGNIFGSLALGPDGEQLLADLVSQQSEVDFSAALDRIEVSYGKPTREFFFGLSKAYDAAVKHISPRDGDTIASFAVRLNGRAAFEVVQDFAKPMVAIFAFQVDCAAKKDVMIPGCLRESPKGLLTDANHKSLFSKELSQLIILMRLSASAQVTPRAAAVGRRRVESCRAAVDLSLQRFPDQVVGNEIEDLSAMPLFFLSRVVKEDASLEPSILSCAQVGILRQYVRPLFKNNLSKLGLGGESLEALSDDNVYPMLIEGGALHDLNVKFRSEVSAIFGSAGTGGDPMGDRLQSAAFGYGYASAVRAPFDSRAYRPFIRSLLVEPQEMILDSLVKRWNWHTKMKAAEVDELFAKLPRCMAFVSQEMIYPFALLARTMTMELFPDPLAKPAQRVVDVRPDLGSPGQTAAPRLALPRPPVERMYRAAFYPALKEGDALLGCAKRSRATGRFRLDYHNIAEVTEVSGAGDLMLTATGLRETLQRALDAKSTWDVVPIGWDQAYGARVTDSPYYAANWVISFRDRFFALRDLYRAAKARSGGVAELEAACAAARRCEETK